MAVNVSLDAAGVGPQRLRSRTTDSRGTPAGRESCFPSSGDGAAPEGHENSWRASAAALAGLTATTHEAGAACDTPRLQRSGHSRQRSSTRLKLASGWPAGSRHCLYTCGRLPSFAPKPA